MIDLGRGGITDAVLDVGGNILGDLGKERQRDPA